MRRDGMDCAPVVYDAEGRAVLGAWKHIPVRNGISFVRYDGDRTVYFVDVRAASAVSIPSGS